jgi:hypothetical protein
MSVDLPLRVEFAAGFLDGYLEDAPAEVGKHWRVIRDHLCASAKAAAALQPFADYAGSTILPDDFVITMGSGMAKRQLTVGDCSRAAAALETIT